ncbi:DUF1906 domain-containing protein [Nocardioides sp. GY 10113]|uniref:glycoside hydrolase domain-containing protein n=1 Tax=Nocardioides sp. GY 10113 TaxID=2569761 RepID=UPI0010A92C49|nr:glycoside hydrolase domain-containing protein [Nocardioides sp. GY 10113]TIC88332.1 DUF1906 domain-containing protein [Nocardioides sp. GY 10113]
MPHRTALTDARPDPDRPAPERPRRRRRTAGRIAAAGVVAALALGALAGHQAAPAAPSTPAAGDAADLSLAAAGTNPVTPGDFTGYGFDQCLAPTQKAMDAWLRSSPFLAVGIYISGNSRACRSQPNLTPTWISTQLRKGWRLLPITLGPQASCATRFPRYNDDPTINPQPGTGNRYLKARRMARAEAEKAVAEAGRLGIVPGSTLWYDLEGFDVSNTRCRESALWFLHGWTTRVRQLGYVSGVYSSASSGIKMLDDARVNRPGMFRLPDQIWIARWDGVANTSSTSPASAVIREDGWRPGGRMKQYQGGHNETWGGVTINIDRNYLELGNGGVAPAESHCGGVRVNFRNYPAIAPAATLSKAKTRRVKALQCLLREAGRYDGEADGRYDSATEEAVRRWQSAGGRPATGAMARADWMRLHTIGARPVLKIGSTGPTVRRLQRALNAARVKPRVPVDGVFDTETARAVRTYQASADAGTTGIVEGKTWRRLRAGR